MLQPVSKDGFFIPNKVPHTLFDPIFDSSGNKWGSLSLTFNLIEDDVNCYSRSLVGISSERHFERDDVI